MWTSIAANVGDRGLPLLMRAAQELLVAEREEDVLAAGTRLLGTGYVDARKVGVFGGSYGGFMTYIALTKKPDRLFSIQDANLSSSP